MNVVGVSLSDGSTAALIQNGKVIAAVSEERFTRIKKQSGFPIHALNYCLNEGNLKNKDIDLLVIGVKNPSTSMWLREKGNSLGRLSTESADKISDILVLLYKLTPYSLVIFQSVYAFVSKLYFLISAPIIRNMYLKKISSDVGISKDKIVFSDHHTCHAFAAYYIFKKSNKPKLVITNDGEGDGYSGKIFLIKENKWKLISKTKKENSIAYLYYYVTKFLGFNPEEEEYKVMGLAGYIAKESYRLVYPIFRKLFWLDKTFSFKSKFNRVSFYSYLRANLVNVRFDYVAASIQRLVEELSVEQIVHVIKKTGVKEIILGGGLAMNIKANMVISKINTLSHLNVCPTPTDESTAIGAAIWGFKQHSEKVDPAPLDNLFLGPRYGNKDIENAINKFSGLKVKRLGGEKNKIIAKLISSQKIVARFSGRMEFGARALGNRSILADPRNRDVINIINVQIKNRDFWMPFAPTILYEDSQKYLVNPKKLESPFMMIGFETLDAARSHIPAALHSYDLSCRPQILKKEANPEYYNLILEFKKLTGVAALLNTSFNIHGEPIVCTPLDALSTFTRSGLNHLIMEDYYIQKVNNKYHN